MKLFDCDSKSDHDAAGRFRPGNTAGLPTRWSAGASGNPAGLSKARRVFEAAFYAALVGEGTAEEAAKLLWAAARKLEPWAVQLLLQRLAPTPTEIRLKHEVEGNDRFDYSKLSDGELEQLEGILLRAAGPPAGELASGEGAPKPG
jgi:hypothetical protein